MLNRGVCSLKIKFGDVINTSNYKWKNENKTKRSGCENNH